MGRPRTIEPDDVLNAAERVVVREGAVNLTVDAVANEAGISKAAVLYDYKTKQALIRALIERRIRDGEQKIRMLIDAEPDQPNSCIRGHLAAARRSFSDEERSVAFTLCAAMAQDCDLLEPVQASLRRTFDEIAASSTSPRGARLAFLALQGLVLLDWFGLHRWSQAERDQLIVEISRLVEAKASADSEE